jgi:hypothetical protein
MPHPRRLLTLLIPMPLVACGGHDDYYYPVAPPPGTYANVQVVNGLPDAPPIDFQLDGATLVRKLDYGQGIGEQPIAPTAHSFVVQVEMPDGPSAVAGPTTLDAAANMDYVVALEGAVGGITALVFPHQLAVVPSGSTQVQVLNATSGSLLNVFLTAPGADLSSSAPFGTAPPEGSIGPTQVTAGEWEIRITASSGASAPVVYDSGTITLQGGTDLVIAILKSLLPQPPALPLPSGPAYQLVAIDASGHHSWLPAVGTWALLRVIHDAPDAPALAVVANSNTTTPLVPTLSYAATSGYLAETPGSYALAITPADNLTDVLAGQRVQLEPGTAHTLFAMGPLAQLLAFVTHDSYRRYADLARLRFIQGAPSANRVDVYLTASGASITSAAPTYAGLPFTADTGFVSYAQGSYDLTVTAAGSKTPIIGPVAVTLAHDGIYTTVARDARGGGAPFGLIGFADDF